MLGSMHPYRPVPAEPTKKKTPWLCRINWHAGKVTAVATWSWWEWRLYPDLKDARPDTVWCRCERCGVDYEEKTDNLSEPQQVCAQNLLNKQLGLSTQLKLE